MILLLITASCIGSAFLLYEALTIPFLHGAGLAQADLELFVLGVVVGLPVLFVSILVIAIKYRQMSLKVPRAILTDPAIIVSLANCLIVVAVVTYSFLIREYGFFWRG